jgi:galactosylceramidase
MDEQGRVELILTRGKRDQKELIGDKEQQAIILARKDVEIGGEYTLAEALAPGIAPCQWHNLKLRFDGDHITGYVDGAEVVQATSDHYRRGMAGLIAPLHERFISTPYFDNLRITPLGRTQANATQIPAIRPLY